MRIERPPELWEVDTEDIRFLPLLGEMIAAGLSAGASLGELTLNASNVVVEASEDEGHACRPAPGEYVALTVKGPADFGPDGSWVPTAGGQGGIACRFGERLETAGARYAYVRRLAGRGSFTVFFSRVADTSHAERKE